MTNPETDQLWQALRPFAIDKRHLRANRIITAARDDPAYTAFDVLRTRILQPMKENGWRRVAITSPSPDCGKTFTAANLAIVLSRYDTLRTVLMDMDLRKSSLHRVLGVRDPGAMGDYLRGMVATEAHFRRPAENDLHIGQNLAIGFNGKREDFASELLQDPLTEEVLEQMEEDLAPDVVLFDMPPVLTNDDVISFLPQVDAVLVVAAGGSTRASELRMVNRHIGDEKPILGVVLNRAEGSTLHTSYY